MKTLIIALNLVFLLFGFNYGQDSKTRTALILVDIQEFYFDNNKMPLKGNLKAAEKASELLEYSREREYRIIHIVHRGGGEIHPLVSPSENEKVIEKQQVNAFRDTELLDLLMEYGIENLILAGMQTHMCLEAATRAGADYGFNCTVIHDACATRDLEFEGKTVKAEDVHASTLNTLKSYAKIVSLEDFIR